MRHARGAVVLVVLLALVACAGVEALETTQRIIDLLAAGEYGRASSLFRQQEASVLSADAGPTWRRGLEHDNPSVREWAIDALSRIAGEGDFERIVGMLGDHSRGVRHQARDGIARMEPERAAEVFRERLRSADPEQVVLAAQGAAGLNDAAAVPALIERLLDSGLPPAARATLAQPLATLGDPEALAPLVRVAEEAGADLQLRRLAAEGAIALGTTLASEQGLESIRRLAASDDDYISELADAALAAMR